MSEDLVPEEIRQRYEPYESRHALAILHGSFPEHWENIMEVLRNFELRTSEIVIGGGGRSLIAESLDKQFEDRGWGKREFETRIVVDERDSSKKGKPVVHHRETDTPTHEVDCFKSPVALEVEWNNKTEFFDRDLNNFRLLFDLRTIGVGVIITRHNSLETLFRELGVYSKYGASSTWMNKLVWRLKGGSGGGCPVAVFGIRAEGHVRDLNNEGVVELKKCMEVERKAAKREKRRQNIRGIIKNIVDDPRYSPASS